MKFRLFLDGFELQLPELLVNCERALERLHRSKWYHIDPLRIFPSQPRYAMLCYDRRKERMRD